MDGHFDDLAAWVSEHGQLLRFRRLQMLDRSDHGWLEFIRAEACTSVEEIKRFYQRLGGYIALIYVLEGNEFNFESIVWPLAKIQSCWTCTPFFIHTSLNMTLAWLTTAPVGICNTRC